MATCVFLADGARRPPDDALLRWALRPAKVWLTNVLYLAALFVSACVSLAHTANAADASGKSLTSASTHDEAVRLIPLNRLPPETRSKVAAVIDNVSLYRRLPTESVDCEPDLFRFLVNNPDVLVNIWKVMGVSNVTLDRVDNDHYRCSDGDGTTARVEVVYRSAQVEVIYADGLYDGPLFPRPVRGQCVAVLQYTNNRQTSGRFEETAKLDTFLHVDNVGIELLAKLFQGLVGRTIDHNFAETVSFIGSVSRTAETNPRSIHRLAGKLDNVEPERRSQFVAVTDRVAMKLADAKAAGDDADQSALAQVIDPAAVENPPRGARK
jgi:hypothetical protein